MVWQDAVISVVNIVFAVSLMPQVYAGYKNKSGPIQYQTSVPTFTGLYILTFTYWTLQLPFATILTFINGTQWLTLCVQRILYTRR